MDRTSFVEYLYEIFEEKKLFACFQWFTFSQTQYIKQIRMFDVRVAGREREL